MKISSVRGREILSKFSAARILVVGDIMLDEFIWGKVSRISPEAPVPVVWVNAESAMPGGAANVVHNLSSLGGFSHVCGVVGKDSNGKKLKKILSSAKVNTEGIVNEDKFLTITKTRIIAHHQQVVRFDRENTLAIKKKNTEKILRYIRKVAKEIDGIIIEDYGKGLVRQDLVSQIIKIAHEYNIVTVIDPNKNHFLDYTGATMLTPNYQEACAALNIDPDRDGAIKELGKKLLRKWKSQAIMLTLGEKGMALFERGKARFFQIPTVAKEVYDVSGAGDTVVAAFTLSLISGASVEEAAIISNQAAGIVVGKLGTAVVTQEEILKAIKENEEKSSSILRS